ncbi:SDR family NAD(P)-dependent oxidoreductase [Geodermatophilus sp. CPCC 205761]|uniref:SDR family NAD(P)-dependent oxidoreductase n=1 Tax=Geodermatophilus sp. CPCC 205761 TaxID=2936597 RepID=UPI003F52F9D5
MATQDDLDETVRQVEALDRRALAVTADVRSQEQMDEAVRRGLAEFGQIDILIANAGIWTQGAFWELSEQAWDEMIGVNLTGVWKSAKAVAPHMIERQTGSIVITSSINGLEPGPNYAHYVAAKHAVVGLMKNIALELAPHGIRCNSVHPAAIKTPMTDHQGAWDMFAGHEGGTEADMIEGGYSFHALKGTTFMSPQVIADTVLYLKLGPRGEGHRRDHPGRRRPHDPAGHQHGTGEVTRRPPRAGARGGRAVRSTGRPRRSTGARR